MLEQPVRVSSRCFFIWPATLQSTNRTSKDTCLSSMVKTVCIDSISDSVWQAINTILPHICLVPLFTPVCWHVYGNIQYKPLSYMGSSFIMELFQTVVCDDKCTPAEGSSASPLTIIQAQQWAENTASSLFWFSQNLCIWYTGTHVCVCVLITCMHRSELKFLKLFSQSVKQKFRWTKLIHFSLYSHKMHSLTTSFEIQELFSDTPAPAKC